MESSFFVPQCCRIAGNGAGGLSSTASWIVRTRPLIEVALLVVCKTFSEDGWLVPAWPRTFPSRSPGVAHRLRPEEPLHRVCLSFSDGENSTDELVH